MTTKGGDQNHLNFLSERLALPMFLSTRISLRNSRIYINRTGNIYQRPCTEDKSPNTKTRRLNEKLIGKYTKNPAPCKNLRTTKKADGFANSKFHNLPPNVHDTTKRPYESRRGLGGAYWHKLRPKIAQFPKQTPADGQWKFYNLPRDIDRLSDRCHKYKGVFLTNARERRGTTRTMTTDRGSVYHDAEDVSPMHYNPQQHTIAHNVVPPSRTKKPNPHLFLPRSYVPDKVSSIVPRHQSFQPAVGRYDIRLRNFCPCAKGQRVQTKQTNLTDWSHVSGGGHRRLFRLSETELYAASKPLATNILAKKKAPPTKLHQENKPDRVPISVRTHEVPHRQPEIRFNTTIVQRRCNISLRKRAKQSAVEIKPNRQAKPRLFEMPAHMRPLNKFEYKRSFKFLPLPTPKILVAACSLFPEMSTSKVNLKPCFYNKTIDFKKYLKKDAYETQFGELASDATLNASVRKFY